MIRWQEIIGADRESVGLDGIANAAEALQIQDESVLKSDEKPTSTFQNIKKRDTAA